jgi:hypothetical protein
MKVVELTAHKINIELDVSDDLARLALPRGVNRRLQCLLDKQDRGESLTDDERAEAEGLVELADLLTLLRLRVERAASKAP